MESHEKSWNTGRPFYWPGKPWKITKVVEKSWKMMLCLMESVDEQLNQKLQELMNTESTHVGLY